jgi:hypothetical protein
VHVAGRFRSKRTNRAPKTDYLKFSLLISL